MNTEQTTPANSLAASHGSALGGSRVSTQQEQDDNDRQLADWLLNRILVTQDPFERNVLIVWTESGKDRARELIFGAFKSARRNTAPNIELGEQS